MSNPSAGWGNFKVGGKVRPLGARGASAGDEASRAERRRRLDERKDRGNVISRLASRLRRK